MPDILRQPVRMFCSGLDLVHPVDRMPPGYFPYLSNVRVVEEGRIEARPGYDSFIAFSNIPNSIRRLNDPAHLLSAGYAFVGGGGPNLYVGPESAYALVDTGYSGNPLTLIPFRPDQSPESWMYVYDSAKLSKVRPDGQVRAQGVAPPNAAPQVSYGPPAAVLISEGDASETWVAAGVSTSTTPGSDRTNGATITIGNIIYDSGTTGWALIYPSSTGTFSWAGERMHVVFDSGGGNEETVAVREIHPPINSTTILGIHYDAGTTGLCTIVLTDNPPGLERNSFIVLAGVETVRVLSVTPTADGIGYSLRCSTSVARSIGDTVDGLESWYLYTTLAHVTSESITAEYVLVTHPGTGAGTATRTVSEDASLANGRPISTANDYFHASIYLSDPFSVTSIILKIDVGDGTFTENYWTWTIPGAAFVGSGVGAFTDLAIALATGVFSGNPNLQSFANIAAVQIGIVSTALCNYGLAGWYFFGTYGPVIDPTDPIGIVYESRFRDASTGAHSVPGPQTRYDVFPLREEVLITPATTTVAGIDEIDIYRLGGAVTQFLYVGSVANNNASPQTYADTLPDDVVLEANQPPDLNALQPFPVLGVPWSGTVNVIGTSVIWVSGTKFNVNLIANTVITINGIAYQTYGQPQSDTTLQISASGGVQTGASYQVSSPELAAQPLAFAFTLEGPFQPVVFALGDPINGGTLYYSNPGDFDSASDQNTLEITGPSDPLISGASWNGLAFTGTREDIYLVRYSFIGSPSPYQWQKIPAKSGIWATWACCSTPYGMAYIGRDGVYLATDQGADILGRMEDGTDPLYPLFPHDGQAAATMVGTVPTLPLHPVDMSATTALRLAATDDSLIFCYADINGLSHTLRYQFSKKRWFWNTYADQISTQYLVEGTVPDLMQVLLLSRDAGNIYLEGGNTDSGADILSTFVLPSSDGGDERGQKLYVDAMVMADGTGTLQMNASYDSAQSFSPTVDIPCTGVVAQSLQNIASLADLSLHLNIGAGFTWVGGPAGPRVYAWEPSGYIQPYLSMALVTQFINLDFTDWKHARRIYSALISNGPVVFTIQAQDGRVYTTTIPSTGGQFKITPQIVRQTCKDLSFAFQLDGGGQPFALFPEAFTVEFKGWTGPEYIDLAVFKT